MADKKKKKDQRFEFSEDVPYMGIMELVEIRTAEMENYMLPNQQTIISNREGTHNIVVKSRELNIKEREYKKKRRTA